MRPQKWAESKQEVLWVPTAAADEGVRRSVV